jgi:hypothetical protein
MDSNVLKYKYKKDVSNLESIGIPNLHYNPPSYPRPNSLATLTLSILSLFLRTAQDSVCFIVTA